MIRGYRTLLGVIRLTPAPTPSMTRGVRSTASTPTVLQEVGRLQKPLDAADTTVSYKTGQLFLHKQFGYRGVILIPWKTKVLESLQSPTLPVNDGENEESVDILCGDVDNPVHERRDPELFYNVLVDATDSSYVRASIDGVSFLGRDSGNDLIVFTMPGLDLVHNKDILPYRQCLDEEEGEKEFPSESSMTDVLLHHYQQQLRPPPIQHELFSKFFTPDFFRETKAEPAHVSTPAFKKWKGRNKRWLKPEMVYRAENAEAGIRVTVIPFYMGSHQEGGRSGKRGGKGGGRVKGGEEPEHYGSKQEPKIADLGAASSSASSLGEKRYWWRYILNVENLGTKSLLIKNRSWSLSTQKGTFDKKVEMGLEGRHTVLSPWNPCAQTTCYCSLEAETGSIWGQLTFVDGEGKSYDCLIPHFTLQRNRKGS